MRFQLANAGKATAMQTLIYIPTELWLIRFINAKNAMV